MKLQIGDEGVDFYSGSVLAGRYNIQHSLKPFLHPLNTPEGWSVSIASPHDHRHHKGLMYALRTREINFWEENATAANEAVGRQRHVGLSEVVMDGAEVRFVESLVWEAVDGGKPVFEENRELRVRHMGSGFAWTWGTRITVRRDSRLIKSQWSWALPNGRRINYHGLGLRLARSFGCTGGHRLVLDGRETGFLEAMGQVARQVTFTGTLDPVWPQWPGPRAAVTFEQQQRNGLFILESPFAFMSLGPSNLEECDLSSGEILEETYHIQVADLRP